MSANQKLVQLTLQELYCPEKLFDKEEKWPKLLCWGNFIVFSKPDFKTGFSRWNVFAWFCFWKDLQYKVDLSWHKSQAFLIQPME